MNIKDIATRALETFGARAQLSAAAEECLELALDCHHYRRGKVSPAKLAEEIAGVEITLEQLRQMVEAAEPGVLDRAREQQCAKLAGIIERHVSSTPMFEQVAQQFETLADAADRESQAQTLVRQSRCEGQAHGLRYAATIVRKWLMS